MLEFIHNLLLLRGKYRSMFMRGGCISFLFSFRLYILTTAVLLLWWGSCTHKTTTPHTRQNKRNYSLNITCLIILLLYNVYSGTDKAIIQQIFYLIRLVCRLTEQLFFMYFITSASATNILYLSLVTPFPFLLYKFTINKPPYTTEV